MNSAAYLTTLHRLLNEYFSLEEIRTLCFNLHIDYESVPGEEKQSRIRELLLGLGRRSRLSDLIPLLQQERPLVDWPPVPDDFQLPESLAEQKGVPAKQYHVYGDMVQGDKVSGDKITIGDVSDGSVVAAGAGAVAVGSRGVYVTGDVYGSIHTGDVINYYITGAQIYFPQFTAAIESFFTYYLGTEKEPVPFGGRNQELAQLDNWLDQESTQRLLLVAPAGRGKSALLARWSQQLTTVENLAVVFMPISIRFNTNREDNTFVILATRLAHFYGKQIPTNYANQSPQMWRGLVAEYLREPLPDGRQLLLILDGLDEAAWDVASDLLPLNLPSSTRVVVSARYLGGEEQNPEPWLRRLGWDRFSEFAKTIELETLSRQGTRDVLERAGILQNQSGSDDEIVMQLHEVSEGDPLLLELYIKDLWQKGEDTARLSLEDIQNVQPGYKGYFKKWWEDQKKLWDKDDPLEKELVNDVLEVLAMAFGPMTVDDLRQILPGQIRSSALKRAIRPINRFVIGDGKEQGFVFSHSKLGEYFRDEMEEDERVAWQTQFLTWGKRILGNLRGEKAPHNVSLYLILYYCRHLEEVNADINEFLRLITWEWMQAWHRKTRSYAGFLQDVDRIWVKLREENEAAILQEVEAPYIGQEMLCALCHASVNSLANNISGELLKLLLQFELWTEDQVIAYLRQRNDIEAFIEATVAVLPYLSPNAVKNIWGDIKTLSPNIYSRYHLLLNKFAPYLPKEVLSAALETKNPGFCRSGLEAVAPFLPNETFMIAKEVMDEMSYNILISVVHYLPEAVLVEARKKQNKKDRSFLLLAVALQLPEPKRSDLIEEGLSVIREIEDERERAIALAEIAPYLPRKMREGMMKQAILLVREDDGGWRKALVLKLVAPYLPEAALMEAKKLDEKDRIEVLKKAAPSVPNIVHGTLEEIKEGTNRIELVEAIAPFLPEKILTFIKETDWEPRKAALLKAAAPYSPEAILAAVQGLDDKWNKADVLMSVAPSLPEESRKVVIEDILKSIQMIEDEWSQVKVLGAVSFAFADKNEYLSTLKKIITRVETSDDWNQSEVLKFASPILPKAVLEAVSELKTEWLKAEVLVTITPSLPQEVLAAALKLHDEYRKAEVLVAVAPYLPIEVLNIVSELKDEKNRKEVLVSIVPYSPESVLSKVELLRDESFRAQLLKKLAALLPQEVLRAVKELADEKNKKRVLVALAPKLPEDVLIEAKTIKDKWGLAQVLIAVLPFVHEAKRVNVLEEVLAVAWMGIGYESERTMLLKGTAPYEPERTLEVARNKSMSCNLAQVLVTLVPYIPAAVLEVARTPWMGCGRVYNLVAIAPYFPEEICTALLEEAYEVAIRDLCDIDKVLANKNGASHLPNQTLAWARRKGDASVMAMVIPFFPESIGPDLVEEAFLLAAQNKHYRFRSEILSQITDNLYMLSQSQLYKVWQKIIIILSRRTRPDLLWDITTLMPIIHRLCGKTAVRDTWQAVQTVSTWWP